MLQITHLTTRLEPNAKQCSISVFVKVLVCLKCRRWPIFKTSSARRYDFETVKGKSSVCYFIYPPSANSKKWASAVKTELPTIGMCSPQSLCPVTIATEIHKYPLQIRQCIQAYKKENSMVCLYIAAGTHQGVSAFVLRLKAMMILGKSVSSCTN